MKLRAWIVAIVGGALTALTLRYALVQAWLPRTVPGAPAGSSAALIASLAAGAVLVLASAALTARWAGAEKRSGAAGAGALAGLLAAGLTYGLYGAAAAGAAGAQAVYPFVAAPVAEENLVPLVDAVLGSLTWTFGMGWAMLLGGGAVGALVGWISCCAPTTERPSPFGGQLALLILSVVGCLLMVINTAVYSQLAQAIADAAGRMGYTLPLPSSVAWDAPVGSALVVLVSLLALGWLQNRQPAEPGSDRYTAWIAYLMGVAALLAVLIAVVMNARGFLSVTGVGLLALLALGLLLILQGWQRWFTPRQEKERLALPGIPALIGTGIGAGTLIAILQWLVSVAMPLNVVLLVIPVIPQLTGEAPSTAVDTALGLVQFNYISQVSSFLLVWGSSCGIVVLIMLLVYGAIWLRQRRQEEAAVPSE